MPRVEYTRAENDQIRAWVISGMTYAEIADRMPDRTLKAVAMQIRRLGLKAKLSNRPDNRSERDYMRRLLREAAMDQPNDNVAMDRAFQEATRKAIAAGLEYVEEGVSLIPCTENPKVVRPHVPVALRSSALICFEHGDNSRTIFA